MICQMELVKEVSQKLMTNLNEVRTLMEQYKNLMEQYKNLNMCQVTVTGCIR